MSDQKIIILLPDGIGLRNFVFTDFSAIGTNKGLEVVYWNGTPFDLAAMGYREIKIENAKPHPLTTLYKNARQQIELDLNCQKTNDKTYNTYRFEQNNKGFKNKLKKILLNTIIQQHSSEKGLVKVRNKIHQKEKQTAFYNTCLNTLKKEKPDIVFCTNQRHTVSIAPILAAQSLGIPTVAFIFSWDNLPKATLVLETDYYCVWSAHMKKELQFYYPYIKEEQIFITGSPQFEPHFDANRKLSREVFFKNNALDLDKKYVCYSGDDITTCPDDPQYLADVAAAVKKLNQKGYNLGIIFRRCPVDFSTRYAAVLEHYKDIIVPLAPLWQNKGTHWGGVLPTKEDMDLQINTVAHSEMVLNLGSSMVFDFATNNKPCGYINYEVRNKVQKDWFVAHIYQYIHFRSMPSKEAVFWLHSAAEIEIKIQQILDQQPTAITDQAQQWFETINQHPAKDASKRIWQAITEICNK
ncbi:UDP-glycosyltransferase [Flavobacterium crassostreae]|uniref:UDP-glycosyltransferase n=1 Tax=Flavobacterium crassostreae TaxID=1763534 RepID=A0A1B9E3N0_9FLAO|nr:UDP-glycosyltransferase [Flavobacterium crassostreae]OCB76545.1 UDP-glycosyltransferase [Flavobacterium crassostreae]